MSFRIVATASLLAASLVASAQATIVITDHYQEATAVLFGFNVIESKVNDSLPPMSLVANATFFDFVATATQQISSYSGPLTLSTAAPSLQLDATLTAKPFPANSMAFSLLSLDFTLTAQHPYTFSYVLGPGTTTTPSLTGPSGPIVGNSSGILPPGDYSLFVEASAVPTDPPQSVTFDLTVSVPESRSITTLAMALAMAATVRWRPRRKLGRKVLADDDR
jgi:hypothetical protein